MTPPAQLRRAVIATLVIGAASVSGAQQQDTSRSSRWQGDWSKPVGDTTRRLYRGLPYGSDAYNTPFSILLNKGYDIFQLRQHSRDIFTFPYEPGWHNGIRNAWQHPGAAIDRFGGWRRFARLELYPSSWDIDEWNWLANYTEHFLGGGFSLVLAEEWYRAHKVPLPKAMAMISTYAASILNEVVEQPDNHFAASAGGVADLLVFDLAPVLLFHWDQPTKFFVETLELADWSNQASITFPNRQLQNNGQYWTMKIPIGLDRTRLFIRGGMGAQFGLSRRLDEEHHFTAALGGDTKVRNVDETGHETIEFAFGGGVFYDRNNSLLWSVTASPAENLLAINVYPGVIARLPKRMGVWSVFTRQREFRIGLSHGSPIGLGAGYGETKQRVLIR